MTAGCARCGECCDPAWIRVSDFERLPGLLGTEDEGPNARFITEYWHPAGEAEVDGWMPVRCDAFDPQTRLCTAHENRPPVCRDYPWYDDGPTAERGGHMGGQCSYLADLPPDQRPEGARPLIPLSVVTR
jgi:Fe-S-cluster containining protein